MKSLRGCAVPAAEWDPLGIAGDRRFLVIDAEGRFLTQRAHARMALVQTALAPGRLTLRADRCGEISVPARDPDPGPVRVVSVTIWQSEGLQAEDCGPAAAEWLTSALEFPCRLVRIGPAFRRPMLERRLPRPLRRLENRASDAPEGVSQEHFVSFVDGYPNLIIGEGSLADLNLRLAARGQPSVPMDRFRPNLVVAGSPAYAEDRWRRFRIGGLVFRAGGPCARCAVTTTDQQTGARSLEPLRTLALYRRDPADPARINFGQNLVPETKAGRLRVGDRVEVIEGEA